MQHLSTLVSLLALMPASPARAEDAGASHRASYQLEAKGGYAGALAKMDALRASGDRSYFVTLRAAWLRYLKGDYAGAEAGYRDAMAANDKAIEPKVGITLVLYAAGHWDQLEVACRTALAAQPTDPTLRARLASAHYNLGRFLEAATAYRRLSEEYPGVLDYQTGHAWALQRMGKRKQARAVFRAVLAVSPDNPSAKQGVYGE